jgi:hypothetical protein
MTIEKIIPRILGSYTFSHSLGHQLTFGLSARAQFASRVSHDEQGRTGSLIAKNTLAPLVTLLRLDRERGDGARLEPL